MREKNQKSEDKNRDSSRRRNEKRKVRILHYLLGIFLSFLCYAHPVLASGVIDDKFSTLYDLIASIVSNVGVFFLLWGVFEFSTAWMGGDGSMQANAFKKMGGGIIAMLAPELVKAMR